MNKTSGIMKNLTLHQRSQLAHWNGLIFRIRAEQELQQQQQKQKKNKKKTE